jgi:hypothetical protein
MASLGNFGAGVNCCYPPDSGLLAANGKKVLDECHADFQLFQLELFQSHL